MFAVFGKLPQRDLRQCAGGQSVDGWMEWHYRFMFFRILKNYAQDFVRNKNKEEQRGFVS